MEDHKQESKASKLRGLEIVSALKAVTDRGLNKSAIITCWRMAKPQDNSPSPRIDLVVREVPILTDRSDRCTIPAAANILASQFDRLDRLYILFDRYAEGVEPPPGHTWDEETRTKCVEVSLMGCLALLSHSPQIKKRLESEPYVLVVGMLEGSQVTFMTDLAAKLIKFVKKHVPSQ